MKVAVAKQPARSITTRYTATILALCLIGMTVLAFMLLYKQMQQNAQYINKLGEMVVKQIAITVDDMIVDQRLPELEQLINDYAKDYNIKGIVILDKQQKIITRAGILPKNPIKVNTPVYEQDDFPWLPFTSQYIIHNHPVYQGNQRIGFVSVIFSYKVLSENFRHQLILMILITIALILTICLGAVHIARRLTTPIQELLEATQDIKEGKIDQIPERRNDEIGHLVNAINDMSQGLIRKTELESLLGKFLTKDVASKVLDQLDPVHMTGEYVEATVLFADIVGFTKISQNISPADVQELLNEYYGYFNACARYYFGIVDKYIGDCIMLVFGALKPDQKHAYHAVACAVLMQKLADRLNQRRKKQGLFSIELRIGINSGKMLAGLIGSVDRMEYTVVGDAVNLASRLCNEANGAQIIIEESLFESINPEHKLVVDNFKSIRIRGKSDTVSIYAVKDIEQTYQMSMDNLIDDILSRV
ncbi:MAG: HAMP domain-containing protein [Cellvibrionales bacterium]|nr:HAMP domain-containing protein [Cellvibrionales bacterium]